MNTDGVTYRDVDGDRVFEAIEGYAKMRSGRSKIREALEDGEVDLIITDVEEGEMYRAKEV